jgi:uncharacterized membrane protein (DUF2068 family)
MMLPLIGAFKLLKSALLLGLALGLLQLAHGDAAATLDRWAIQLHIDPDGEHLGPFVQKVLMLDQSRLHALSAGLLAYASLFLVEGVGLMLKKRWAEWLTVVATASLVPLEVYEIFRHPRPLRVALLVVNLAIVWYLAARLRRAAMSPVER